MSEPKKIRLLWASFNSLLDTSSGASIAVREILHQLTKQGFEISILTASIFDNPRGSVGFRGSWGDVSTKKGKIVSIKDDTLKHHLLVTESTVKANLQSSEESLWFAAYQRVLASFKPDIVFYYGGQAIDFLISDEAKHYGAAVAFLLVNGNYRGHRWYRDVDLVLTDSQATADLYQQRLGIKVLPTGTFINPSKVVAKKLERKHVLFINPSLQKGVSVVTLMALVLEKSRPDIIFEVVDSRGGWSDFLIKFTKALGQPRESLSNVLVTPHTHDMREVYQRAKVVLVPSLWWESGARVVGESLLNGIPLIITDNGGMPEMMGDAGVKIKVSERITERSNYNIPTGEDITPFIQAVKRFYDDENYYAEMVQKAKAFALQHHDINKNVTHLAQQFRALAQKSQKHHDKPYPLVLVCGPWGSGTSAVTGFIHHMGVFAPGSFYEIADEKTPDTFEMELFRKLMRGLVSEKEMQVKQSGEEINQILLKFRDQVLPLALDKLTPGQNRTVLLKHPLAAFILTELSQLFSLKLIVVTRPLQEIEQTRLRRGWNKNYGAHGAQKIYNNIFSTLMDSKIQYSLVAYDELLARPEKIFTQLSSFLDLSPSPQQRNNAINSVRR